MKRKFPTYCNISGILSTPTKNDIHTRSPKKWFSISCGSRLSSLIYDSILDKTNSKKGPKMVQDWKIASFDLNTWDNEVNFINLLHCFLNFLFVLVIWGQNGIIGPNIPKHGKFKKINVLIKSGHFSIIYIAQEETDCFISFTKI